MSSPSKNQKRRQKPSAGAGGGGGGGKVSQHTSSTSRGSTSSAAAGGGGDGERPEQGQKGAALPSQKRATTASSISSQSTSQERTHTQKSAHDLTAPIRKRTSISGSRDEGEGGTKEGEGHAATVVRKPSTKAERRAVQEAQRQAKAGRQIVLSKAGQVAREEKIGKDTKTTGHKGTGGGGGDDKPLLQISSHHSRSGTSRAHDVSGLKQVQHFSHLPQFERKERIINLLKDHHPPPCIIQLGLQYSEQLVCGSNARCVALLAAFKKIIQEYTTPPKKELRRDLDAVIKPHINFLAQCRPLSVSMGNAIKHLKLRIAQVPPDMTDNDAKKLLCGVIDDYIREKIELAGEAISQFCGKVIKDGDVILVHGHSSIVQCCLIDAHKSGKKFRVVVVDSRPKMEGRECLRQLLREGIKCSYVMINAVSYIMKEVSKVICGAHGLLANGYVMSRIGTSLIAMVAKSYNVPVLVCCETYKFCDKVQTDAFVTNELGDPNDLVPINRRQGNFLSDWKSIENLQLLNLVYDVTSPDLITMVITQLGNIPCTSVPVVLRISRSFEQM